MIAGFEARRHVDHAEHYEAPDAVEIAQLLLECGEATTR